MVFCNLVKTYITKSFVRNHRLYSSTSDKRVYIIRRTLDVKDMHAPQQSSKFGDIHSTIVCFRLRWNSTSQQYQGFQNSCGEWSDLGCWPIVDGRGVIHHGVGRTDCAYCSMHLQQGKAPDLGNGFLQSVNIFCNQRRLFISRRFISRGLRNDWLYNTVPLKITKSVYFTIPFTNLVNKTHNVTQLSNTKDWLKIIVYFSNWTHHSISLPLCNLRC